METNQTKKLTQNEIQQSGQDVSNYNDYSTLVIKNADGTETIIKLYGR